MRYLLGIFYGRVLGIKWVWEKVGGEMVGMRIGRGVIYG